MGGPSKPKLADPGALIRAGKRRRAEYKVCTDPDLTDAYDEAVSRRAQIMRQAKDSLAGADTAEVDAEIEQLLPQIEEQTVTLVFESLPRPAFKDMMDRHPPRRNAEGAIEHIEDQIGVNFDPFFDELVRASVVSPKLADEDLTYLLEELLNDRQWVEVTDVVWLLNKRSVSVPFSSASSARTRTS